MERETTVARTSLSRGLQADPSKWKGSMLWWQVPKQPWVTASFQEFSDEVWIEAGEVVLGTLCSLKVAESTLRFWGPGAEEQKGSRKRASVCPSPNLLFVVHEYSLRTRLHWRFRVLTHGLLFITVVGRKLKKKKKEVRKLCEEVTARRYHALPGQFFQKTHDSLHKYCRRNLAGQCPEVYPWNEKKKCKLFLLWYDLIWTTVIMKK